MFDFNAPTPTGFHSDFALCVMIPLAEAAYAVMNQPGVAPQLPPGFQMTGLIQADESPRQAILNLPNQSNAAKAMMPRWQILMASNFEFPEWTKPNTSRAGSGRGGAH